MAKLVTICEDERFEGRSSRHRYYSMLVLKNVDAEQNTGEISAENTSVEVEKLDDKMKMKSYRESPEDIAMVVGNNSNIYIIGGSDSEGKPKRDVLILPLIPNPNNNKSQNIIQKGPSLISGKLNPIVIPSKTHLFVFSRILFEFGFKSGFSYLEEVPRCEVISWDSGSVWSALDIPSEAPPLPPPYDRVSKFRFQIDAYASGVVGGVDGVFISIKNVCCYFVSVGEDWKFKPKELPFISEAKVIGSGSIYAATPRDSLYAGFLFLYRLVPCEDSFLFNELTRFPLFSTLTVGQSFPDHNFGNWMFQPLSANKICVIHSCAPPDDDICPFNPFLIAKVLELKWDADGNGDGGDDGATSSTKKRKRNTKTDKKPRLLGYTKYPNVPPPQNWCLVPNVN